MDKDKRKKSVKDILKGIDDAHKKYRKPKKPKKKFVGLAAKAKRRKQVSESRLAQRTGISARDRRIKELIKKLIQKPKFYRKGERPNEETAALISVSV